jgi:hypothetical protein
MAGLVTRRAIVPGDLLQRETKTEAVYSECGQYRYYLCWRWSDAPALYVWMLNPSTATHEHLDNTVKGLIKHARQWGYGAVVIINLFAFRATQPRDMLAASDPVGPHNDATTLATLRAAVEDGSPVVAAWGTDGKHRGRAAKARAMAKQLDCQLFVFQFNMDGSPGHPLYIPHEVRPSRWVKA